MFQLRKDVISHCQMYDASANIIKKNEVKCSTISLVQKISHAISHLQEKNFV